jgi:hypothetical protein
MYFLFRSSNTKEITSQHPILHKCIVLPEQWLDGTKQDTKQEQVTKGPMFQICNNQDNWYISLFINSTSVDQYGEG